jgi:hypothetical protein
VWEQKGRALTRFFVWCKNSAVIFRIAKDPQLDRKRWLYGFEEPRDELANKAAGTVLCYLSRLARFRFRCVSLHSCPEVS